MRVVRFGEAAWLVYTDRPLALAAAIPGSVPGADCVLVHDLSQLGDIADLPDPEPAGEIQLAVTWDGEDLSEVEQRTGIDVAAVLTSTEFTVAFCGFAPGFAYMTGLPQSLHLPRRDRPRPHVAAGSVAIAAGYLAIYPTASPGGWHLLGHCRRPMFDAAAEPPALLTPGIRVRFS